MKMAITITMSCDLLKKKFRHGYMDIDYYIYRIKEGRELLFHVKGDCGGL